MKISSYFIIALLSIAFLACSNDSQNNTNQAPAYNPPTTTPQPASPSAPAAGGIVHHYICPNNCAGSGAAQAGTCPVCNSQYLHNAAYHNQPGAAAANPGGGSMFQQGQAPQNLPTPTSPQTAAQNAAGVWHYTCSNGCAGGAGSAGTCATCGGALAHNAAYHN